MGIHPDYFGENLDPEVSDAFGAAVRDLEKLGMERIDVSIPEIRYQGTCRDVVLYVEAASYHEASLRARPEAFSERTRELLRLGLLIRGTEYLTAQRARRRVLQAFREAFKRFDVLVTPTVPVPAPRIGEETLSNGEELRPALLRLVSPFNTVGFPALSLPCGYTQSGLPIGLQLAAAPFQERLLLKVAHAYERSHHWLNRRPLPT
jgi:aspartyl-tRNA(Asn)/glutamyl-tRNA(Gln) amidotransferase subunit A